jgi:hypothetical protein
VSANTGDKGRNPMKKDRKRNKAIPGNFGSRTATAVLWYLAKHVIENNVTIARYIP